VHVCHFTIFKPPDLKLLNLERFALLKIILTRFHKNVEMVKPILTGIVLGWVTLYEVQTSIYLGQWQKGPLILV